MGCKLADQKTNTRHAHTQKKRTNFQFKTVPSFIFMELKSSTLSTSNVIRIDQIEKTGIRVLKIVSYKKKTTTPRNKNTKNWEAKELISLSLCQKLEKKEQRNQNQR